VLLPALHDVLLLGSTTHFDEFSFTLSRKPVGNQAFEKNEYFTHLGAIFLGLNKVAQQSSDLFMTSF
jgi:hypothetical protein